jgi:hypothetical protein
MHRSHLVQNVDSRPTDGAVPDYVTVDEIVTPPTDERFRLYAAVDQRRADWCV